jgi:hypothetical protein
MRVSLLSRLFVACSMLPLLLVTAAANKTSPEALKMLPERAGDFRARGAALPCKTGEPVHSAGIKPEDFNIVTCVRGVYISPRGESVAAEVFQTSSDASAYALLSRARVFGSQSNGEGIGIASAIFPGQAVAFSKGSAYVVVYGEGKRMYEDQVLAGFARLLADKLDAGSGELPVLVKHLPDWERKQEGAIYAVTLPRLKEIVRDQPILDVVSFDGGTEAVVATYDQGARLAIVEYATPQLAFDADAQIKARIAALPGEGKPAPSAYRRIGNYAVFVFDAPDEQAATGLINKVTYEKDVRWLGENPYAVERANRAWLNMSTSVIVNTVKATGLAIVICLSIGGVFGGWIFMRRRAQAALTEKFSDAGGMLRLNIDEMSAQNNAARLIGEGDKAR